MMTESTTGIWVTDPPAYRRKLKELLGASDPMESMAQTVGVLSEIVKGQSAERMQTRPFPGKWTPNEIIGHLCDSEWVYGYRLRMILAEHEPVMLGMDHDAWVPAQRHNDRATQDLLGMFGSLREFNLAVWRDMKPADLKRFGKHDERGTESLGDMLVMLAGHDRWHIDQLTRYVAAVAAS